MNHQVAAVRRRGHFQLRPAVLVGCTLLFAVAVLPIIFSHKYYAQLGLLLAACVCVVLGWFFLVRDRQWDAKWRGWIALVTSVYLTLSIPGFLIEFSSINWLMHAHWASIYVRPWVHWGFIYVYLSVAGSFLGRGRTRIAFVLASVLLMVLWESMAPWIY